MSQKIDYFCTPRPQKNCLKYNISLFPTRQIKSKIREAQANQQRFQDQQNRNAPKQEQFQKKDIPSSDAEYIDYEEVK